MSKSATEQYQIKKKRKHNKNKASSSQVKNTNKISKNPIKVINNNNNNKYKVYNGNNKNPIITGAALIKQLTLTEICLQQQQRQQQNQYPFTLPHNYNSIRLLAHPEQAIIRIPNVENDVVVTRLCAQGNNLHVNAASARQCCIRDLAQVVLPYSARASDTGISANNTDSKFFCTSKRNANCKMPLSQGFSAKVCGGAVKRTATKPALPRQVDAAKRSKSATADRFAHLNQQQYLHARHNYSNSSSKGNATSYSNKCSKGNNSKFAAAYKPATAFGSHSPLSAAGGNYAPAAALTHNNNLQFYYLLAESLTRYGSLLEAFDVYAFIASEQLDSCIPLDRLNTFASALITYVRQMGAQSNSSVVELVAAVSQSGGKFSEDTALESSLKAKYARSAASWTGAAGGVPCGVTATTPPVPDAVVGAGLSDLHSPTRELLRVPSPTQSEDYDPLLCPLCSDILRCPVTTNCGHTFCRQCCETITQCNICHVKFPRSSFDDFVSDVSSGIARNYTNTSSTTLTTLTTATVSSASVGVSSASTGNAYIMPSTSAVANANASTANANRMAATSAAPSDGAPAPSNDNPLLMRRLQTRNIAADSSASFGTTVAPSRLLVTPAPTPPPTVTTATVASTTATATTTMASSASGGGGAGSGGVAASIGGAAANMKFMPDVLVRRLVEKWWGADLQAKKNNETAASYMHMNLLDDALKFCNASLEKSPANFKSLLLRAEVLRKLNHFQSSLADVENALKTRYSSAKAHYLRALALCDLGRCDEALYDNCLAISLDKDTLLTSSELFQHDLAKNLQKLLAQTPKSKSLLQRTFSSGSAIAAVPYKLLTAEQHLRRRKEIALLSNANGDNLSSFDDEFIPYDSKCDIIADSDYLATMDGAIAGGDDAGSGASIAEYISGIGDTLMDKRFSIYAGMEKHFDIELRRQTSRKHFRRKWTKKETELMPTLSSTLEEVHYSALFRNILNRVQQELQRLKKLDLANGAPQKPLLQVPASLVDASDFDCVLCCRTFWKPVVTPCGHTYCRVCLDRCMDYTSSCPLCMSPLVEPNVNTMYQGSSSPVPFIVAKRPVTKFLEAAMKRFIPDSYEKRFRQEIDLEPSVPVFICTTAFPYVPCPLFVYEPRYRLMVRRAVESGEKQFGIVQPNSGKSRYFDVGTMLDIRDCVLLGDGCSILSTVGCKRFKILARNEKDGYETAKVEYIYDETIPDEMVKMVNNMHAIVLGKAIDWFESLSTELKQEILQSLGEMPAVEENWETIADGPAWAWWIIALLPLNQQLKVDILATTSLEKRLRAIEKTLDYMSGTLRRTQQHDCSVVMPQQHQQQQQQQQQQLQQDQQEECENELLQCDECCQRTTTNALRTVNGEPHHHHHEHHHHHHHASSSEQQLLL